MVLSIAFFGSLRGAEYTGPSGPSDPNNHLIRSDLAFGVTIQGTRYIILTIGRTKCSPHGITKYIGCSYTSPCAVCDTINYLKHRDAQFGSNPSNKLFVFQDGSLLTKPLLNSFIKYCMQMLGFGPAQYSSHSIMTGDHSKSKRFQ